MEDRKNINLLYTVNCVGPIATNQMLQRHTIFVTLALYVLV